MLIPAAQYLRTSKRFQEVYLERQATISAEFAIKHGFRIVKTYKDPARSGIARINIPFDQEYPTNTFTLVKVLMSQEEAEEEVSRLNQVNAGTSCVYLYCTSRLVENGDSDVPEDTVPAANE